MSGLEILLMTGIDDEFPFTKFFPLDYSDKKILAELLIIAENFKHCGKGRLQHKNKIFYYRTYTPTLPTYDDNSKSESKSFSDFYVYSYDCSKKKFFFIFSCDLNYKPKDIDNFTDEIFEVLDKGAFDGHELKKDVTLQINNLFEKYKKLFPNLSSYNQLTEFNAINNSIDSIGDNNSIGSINKKYSITKKRIDPRMNIIKRKKDTNDNASVDIDDLTTIKEDDTDLSIMFKQNLDDNLYLPQVKKWKTIKIVNIILCGSLLVIMIILLILFIILNKDEL